MNRPVRGSMIGPASAITSRIVSARPSRRCRSRAAGCRSWPGASRARDARRSPPASAARGRSARPRASSVGCGPSAARSSVAHLVGLGEAGAGQRRVERVALHARGGVEHGLAVAGDEPAAAGSAAARTQAMAAASIAVGGAAQPIMVADQRRRPSSGSRRPCRCRCASPPGSPASARGVGRPGVAAAAEQLEAAPVDPEQHRRSLPLLAAQPDVELAAAAPRRPVADRRRRRASPARAAPRTARRSRSSGRRRGTRPSCRKCRATAAAPRPGGHAMKRNRKFRSRIIAASFHSA